MLVSTSPSPLRLHLKSRTVILTPLPPALVVLAWEATPCRHQRYGNTFLKAGIKRGAPLPHEDACGCHMPSPPGMANCIGTDTLQKFLPFSANTAPRRKSKGGLLAADTALACRSPQSLPRGRLFEKLLADICQSWGGG